MPDRSSRGGIAGILAPDLIAGLEDCAQHDPQGVLCSRRQHDLVRIAAQPSRRQQMIGNRGAQLAAAPGVAVLQVLGTEGAHAPAGKRPEALQRPFIDMRAAERQRALLRRLDRDVRLAGVVDARGNPRGDEGAGADGGYRKPVRDQPLIGRSDGVAAKAGLLCQRALRRQRLAGFCDPACDGVAERLIEPVLRGGIWRHVGSVEVERKLGLAPRRRRIGRNFSHGIGTIADQIRRYNFPRRANPERSYRDDRRRDHQFLSIVAAQPGQAPARAWLL